MSDNVIDVPIRMHTSKPATATRYTVFFDPDQGQRINAEDLADAVNQVATRAATNGHRDATVLQTITTQVDITNLALEDEDE